MSSSLIYYPIFTTDRIPFMSLLISILLSALVVFITDKGIIGDLLHGWQRAAFLVTGLTAAYVVAGGTILAALEVALIVSCTLWAVDYLFTKVSE